MPSIFVFDAYGTLFDVHAAILRCGQAGPDADRMSEIWRAKQLEYTWTLTLAGHYADFWTLTERALDFALARVPSVDKALKPKLLDAYFKLDAFPDARAALARAQSQGPQDRHSVQRLAQHAQGRGRCRRHRRRSRRRAVGRRAENVQAAAGGLPARHRSLQMQSRRRDLRVVQPLGRDGGHFGRLPRLWVNRGKMPDEYLDFPPKQTLSDLNALAGHGLSALQHS